MTEATTTAAQTRVAVRFFAAAAEAAGTPEEVHLLDTGASGAALVAALTAAHGDELGRILAMSSLLADGTVVTDLAAPLTAHEVDVLPPFAGG